MQRQGMTEAGIGSYWGSNIFSRWAMTSAPASGACAPQVRPLANYVWPAAFMALGGGIAASDRRYRTAKVPAADEVTTEGGALPGKAGDESIYIAARRLRAARSGAHVGVKNSPDREHLRSVLHRQTGTAIHPA